MRLIAVVVGVGMLAPAVARAEDSDTVVADEAPAAGDRELGARVGLAGGGRSTPGGLRVGGQLLYQLSDLDWFDGTLDFTFGGGGTGCMVAGDDVMRCDHGALDGFGGQVTAGVRHWLPGKQGFQPWVRAATGVRIVRYSDDYQTGLVIPLIAAAGVRDRITDGIALGAEAALELGAGMLSDAGLEPQLGLAITGVVEFRLK